jgi:hypothetical protein
MKMQRPYRFRDTLFCLLPKTQNFVLVSPETKKPEFSYRLFTLSDLGGISFGVPDKAPL